MLEQRSDAHQQTLAGAMCTLTALAWAADSASAQSSISARGETIAERLCARCHGIRQTGPTPMALAPPFRDLPKRYPIEHLAEALAAKAS